MPRCRSPLRRCVDGSKASKEPRKPGKRLFLGSWVPQRSVRQPARRGSRGGRLLLAVALALACAPAAALAQEGPPPEPVDWKDASLKGEPIREIVFEGIHRATEDLLRARDVRTKVGDAYDLKALLEDVTRLHASGRFLGDIGVGVFRLGPGGGLRIVFRLTEREEVKKVTFEGLDAVSERDLTKEEGDRLRTKVGDLLDPYKLDLDRAFIVRKVREKGKLFAEVEAEPIELPEGVEVVFRVSEGPTVRVGSIRFIGNDHVPAKELRRVMRTLPYVFIVRSGYFDRDQLDDDLDSLARYYRGKGYLNARIFLEDLGVSDDRSRVHVVVRVDEDERFFVRDIRVEGVTLYTPGEVEGKLELKEGEPFDGPKLERDLRTISKLFSDLGHIFARVNFRYRTLPEPHRVDLIFDVIEGERIAIEKVKIEGNFKTRDDVVRREIGIVPGEPFSSEEMDESRRRLFRRGLFKDVKIRFEEGTADDRRDLVIDVTEGDTGQILFGGGVSSSVGVFGRFVYVQRNFDIARVPTSLDDILEGRAFAGAGQVLVLQAEPGRERQRYRVTFTEPYLFPSVVPIPLQLKLTGAFFDSVAARSYSEQQVEGIVGFGYRLSRDALAELEYRLARVTIFDIEEDAPADVIEVSGDNLVSSVRLGASIDRNEIDPNFLVYGGFGANASVEVAGTVLGGDHDFVRLETGANWQTKLFEWPGASKHVLGLRAQAGWMEEIPPSDEVPIFERFFAGGAGLRRLRGFEFRSVGPQEDDEPIGGSVLALGGVEYGFPLVPGFDETYSANLRGVLFLDAGFVESRVCEIDLDDDLRVSVGVGVRIRVPFFPAPVALDFGFPIRDADTDDEEIFSFTVGTGLP